MHDSNIRLHLKDSVALVSPWGAALIGLELQGRLIMPEIRDHVQVFGGSLLAPWPNRILGASYRHGGKTFTTEALDGHGNALHGLVFDQKAELLEKTEATTVLKFEVSPSAAYPGNLEILASFTLAESSLEVVYRIRNIGAESAPVGIGAHPYFPFGAETQITLGANTAAIHGPNKLPISELPAADIQLGPEQISLVSDLDLDTQFTDLSDPVAVIREPDFVYEIWQQNADWLMVYTTQDFPWVSSSAGAIAIEPQTCAADAFNNGEGLRILEPGHETQMRWGVRLRS